MEPKLSPKMKEVLKHLEEESFDDLIHNVQIKSILENKDLLPALGGGSAPLSSGASGNVPKSL